MHRYLQIFNLLSTIPRISLTPGKKQNLTYILKYLQDLLISGENVYDDGTCATELNNIVHELLYISNMVGNLAENTESALETIVNHIDNLSGNARIDKSIMIRYLQILSIIPIVNILALFALPFVMMVYVAIYENTFIKPNAVNSLESGIRE